MSTSGYGWGKRVLALYQKELRSELRTRYALNSLILFAVVSLTAVSLAVGQFALSIRIKSSFFWVVLFFSAMSGLAQVFIKEEESKTSYMLKLAASPGLIYTAKLLYNFTLLLALEVAIVPLFSIFLGLNLENFSLFLAVAFLGSAALASATTIIGAIVSKASVKSALFAVLSFPLLIPVLVMGMEGTYLAAGGARFAEAAGQLAFLLSYTVVLITVSLNLFEFVWSE
jgi:heme exporter protein B